MNNNTPSTSLRTVNRLYKEAKELFSHDPLRAGQIAEDALRRLLARSLVSVVEQRKHADLLLLIARCEQRSTHTGQALEYAKQALAIFENLMIDEECAWALNAIGVLYWMRGEHCTAQEYLRQCLERAGDSQLELHGIALANLGMVCWYLGEYSQALVYMQKSLAIDEEIKDYNSMLSVLLNIGNLYSNNGDDADAIKTYFRGFDILDSNISGDQLQRTHHIQRSMLLAGIGSVFLRAGEYDRALEHYLRSLAIAEEMGNQDGIATALLNIGIVYQHDKELELGHQYMMRSLVLREEMQDIAGRSVCLVNLAMVLQELGRVAESLECAMQGAELCAASGDRRVLSYALLGIGKANCALGNNGEALAALDRGLNVSREIGYVKSEISMHIEMSVALRYMGRYAEACGHLDSALVLATNGSGKLLLDVHQAFAELYEQQSMAEKALEHYKQVYKLRDATFGEKADRRLQVLHVAYQVEEARKKAKIYRLKTEQLEQQVKEQKRKVATKTMHLTQHADFLHRIKKVLTSSLAGSPEILRRDVRQVIATINSTLDDKQAWNTFEGQFRQMHPTFTEALGRRWPALSSVELRVCSLLRLNMSSKEICRVLNIAPRSVDVYRHRIRKKLELGSEENLTAFLAGIS